MIPRHVRRFIFSFSKNQLQKTKKGHRIENVVQLIVCLFFELIIFFDKEHNEILNNFESIFCALYLMKLQKKKRNSNFNVAFVNGVVFHFLAQKNFLFYF